MTLLRSELVKLRTTRAALGIFASLVALVALVAALQTLTSDAAAMAQEATQRDLVAVGASATLFATLAGILAMTGEVRHGTITPTLLAEPRRERVLLAKLGGAAIVGALLGAAGYALAAVALPLALAAHGVDGVLSAADLAAIAAGTIAAGALSGALGVGVGAVVHSQVAAVSGFLIWLLVVEPVATGVAASAARFFPGQAASGLAGATGAELLGRPSAGALLAAYVTILAIAGVVRTRRADIS